LIASVALGNMTFDDISEATKIDREFIPDPVNRSMYDSVYKEFLAIYKKNCAIYRRLNT